MVLGSMPGTVYAYENYTFSHFKGKDGLPHQQVEAMAFDHDGMLWIGTRNGLTKYDGYSFVTYYCTPGDSATITDNFIHKVFVDADNNVWIGTDSGICRYLRDTDTFKRYDVYGESVYHIAQTGRGTVVSGGLRIYRWNRNDDSMVNVARKHENLVVGMDATSDNRIFILTNRWISTIDIDTRNEISFNSDLYSDFLPGTDAIAPMITDHKGQLWIGRDGKGVMCVNPDTGQKKVYGADMLSDGTVRCMAEDSRGCIWLGTEAGVTIIDPSTDDIDIITEQYGSSSSLSDNHIYCIAIDRYDNVWVGTYFGGVNLMLRNSMKFLRIQPGYNDRSLRGKVVRRVIEPEPEVLWMATEDGGVNILDLATGDVRFFDEIPELGSNVHELYFDRQTRDIWIGTFRTGLFRYNLQTGRYKHYTVSNSKLKSNLIFAMAWQNNVSGRLWVATTLGLMYYDPATDDFMPVNHPVLDYNFSYCLLPDRKGNLWVGTVIKGLFRIDGETGDIINWNTESGPADGLKDNYITSLFEDNSGRIFLGTNNNGVQILDGNSLKFRDIPGTALEWGTVCCIDDDEKNDIWITTSRGLVKMDSDNLSYIRFTTLDGLPENQFNFSSILLASDGRMYCGTVNGLVSFSPDIAKNSDSKLSVHLRGLTLNNDLITPGSADSPLTVALDATDVLELDYDESRMFGIDYGVINPSGTDNVRYQIFIDGLDRGWRDVGTLRRFTATKIPYGTYVFNVRALASGEDWESSPIKTLKLRIAPPWYMSPTAWTFYVVFTLLICYALYLLFLWRMKEKQRKKMDQINQENREELNREKLEFFTNISHELKTPLSLILAPLKQLSANESLSDESRRRLSTAIANTSKMVELINELVTFNRVESGNFRLLLCKGNPLTLIETVSGYFRNPALGKNITINVMTQNNGEDVWFSATYLECVLGNLLSNAIKYTDEGGVVDVKASIVERDDNSVYVKIEVKDTGRGIEPEELDCIFHKYYRIKSGYDAQNSGWGVGLATVKKLVEAHKGSVSVSSAVGKGSTFVVYLNVTPGAFEDSAYVDSDTPQSLPEHPGLISNTLAVYDGARGGESASNDDGRMSMLIVEDNPQLLHFLADDFSKTYNVFTASDGIQALAVTAEHPIDIVVSDVMMPEMDGIELCERLKNDLSTSHIPVILLTAKNDKESTFAGFKSGAEAYVAKPFDPELLELRVKNILRVRKAYINSQIKDSKEDNIEEDMPQFNEFDNGFIARVNDIVDTNMDNSEFSIADITKALGISRSLLHIKMKTFFNMSMSDYIKKRRMAKACELLKQGNNVSETAYRTGFADPNYFSKVFRKTFGMSPTDYISNNS